MKPEKTNAPLVFHVSKNPSLAPVFLPPQPVEEKLPLFDR